MHSTTSYSDAVLIRRTLAGHRMAYEVLVERHRRSVMATAASALGNADDAQDVTQEAFVYAYLRLAEVRDPHRFAAWLRSVTLSLCVDYRRRRGTRRLGEPITALNEISEEEDYAASLTIRQAVSHLSDGHQAALLLHHVGGWSQEEVAALLDIPRNTVRSRLRAAKAALRSHLDGVLTPPSAPQGTRMSSKKLTLSEAQTALLRAAFPNGRILTVQNSPDAWMPFCPRVRLALPDDREVEVDFRPDLDASLIRRLPVLDRLGIPVPRLIHAPLGGDESLSLCGIPRGENLTLWALGGTPHRMRLATERAFEGIDRLQGATQALQDDPIGGEIERRTLSDKVAILTEDDRWNASPWLAEEGKERRAWLGDPWFRAALAQIQSAAADIKTPLAYTDYRHFFPQNYRILASTDPTDIPLGAPGDPILQKNPLAEIVCPHGHFGDPLLGLAMVWVYDCYPFVHTGFVEQYLWRRGVPRREFAPRLALKALQMIARDLPAARPSEGASYWDGLRGWAEQALSWM